MGILDPYPHETPEEMVSKEMAKQAAKNAIEAKKAAGAKEAEEARKRHEENKKQGMI